jgi:AraC-like DNA-binding protein
MVVQTRSGRRTAATGVGGRWHSHAEMEFTIFQRGSGMRYVGDHVGAFGEGDCVLLGSHLPQTQDSITEIAYASGFGRLTRFNAAFREKFDQAPRELRSSRSPK